MFVMAFGSRAFRALKPRGTPDSGDCPLLCDVVPDVARRQTRIGTGKRSPLKPIWPAILLEINKAPQEGLHYLSLLWN